VIVRDIEGKSSPETALTGSGARPRVLCSMGAIARGPQAISEHRIVEIAPLLDVDGVEVMIYESWYDRLDQVADQLAASGLVIPATHGEKSIGPDLVADSGANRDRAFQRFDDNCRFTARIGGDRVVLHLWGLPDADALIDGQLDDLPTLLDIANRHNVMLAVEAIPCVVHDPLRLIHRVLDTDSRAKVALDTEFLGMHDQLDDVFTADWLWEADAVVHVHVKDFDGSILDPATGRRRYLHPGEGNIAFDRWFDGLRDRGYRHAVSLESPIARDDGTVDFASANGHLRNLRSLVEDGWARRARG
jgi:sugar phosphate isomerase/epimerase